MIEEICGTCKFNFYDKEDKRFYCDNEDSDTYGTPNDYEDGCENWEDKDGNV